MRPCVKLLSPLLEVSLANKGACSPYPSHQGKSLEGEMNFALEMVHFGKF